MIFNSRLEARLEEDDKRERKNSGFLPKEVVRGQTRSSSRRDPVREEEDSDYEDEGEDDSADGAEEMDEDDSK